MEGERGRIERVGLGGRGEGKEGKGEEEGFLLFCLVFYRSTGELSYALKEKEGRKRKTERERQKRTPGCREGEEQKVEKIKG